jgi:DNA-binding transcriptional LysR family regulator
LIANNGVMETRRLHLLLELSRLGSMREVADELGVTTSTVSQQIAALARECGTPLIEPEGRRVRLTPAGRRLAERAVGILAEVEAARLDLDPGAEPAGTIRIAGFATAIRRSLLPIVADLAITHPRVQLLIHEHEPNEAFGLLATDDIDLALTYDYNLAPASFGPSLERTPLWSAAWGLGIPVPEHPARPSAAADTGAGTDTGTALSVFQEFAEHPWIVNSRNTADGDVVRTIASMAGFEPRITHRADSLELVEHLIVAGLGVGLLPIDRSPMPGVVALPLTEPDIRLRAYAVTRRGRSDWPPLALVLRRLTNP